MHSQACLTEDWHICDKLNKNQFIYIYIIPSAFTFTVLYRKYSSLHTFKTGLMWYMREYSTLSTLLLYLLIFLSVFSVISLVHIKDVRERSFWSANCPHWKPDWSTFHCHRFCKSPSITSGLLFQGCGILLEGSTGIFSKGHLSHSPFSYMTFRKRFFTDMFDSIGTV